MREVTIYYAYDDKEFDNYLECVNYENKGFDLILSIANKYFFYKENMEEIFPPSPSPHVEDWLTWLDDAYSDCTYIRKMGNLTDDEAEIIRENIGACIFNEDFSCAVGLFEYNTRTGAWDKVDE